MATAATRHRLQHHLRRALSLSTSRRHLHTTSSPKILSFILNKNSVCFQNPTSHRLFHCSHPCFAYSKPSFNDVDKIDPDTILFEGCDYKHWLIVMDFGKDPNNRPPPEQMVETYVQTLAKVVGSVEEAKKKIYACSTTTYTGFQAEIDEETSKKLEDLPGVIFVLPDSYIDPVNKEYGGDKYINGTIIPRPPPVQYGRIRRDSDQRSRGRLPQRERTGEGGRSTPMSDRTHYTNEGRTNYQSGGNTYAPPQSGYHNQGMPYQGTYNQGMPSQGSYNLGMPSQAAYNQGMPSQATYNQATPSHQGSYNQGYTQSPRFEHSGNRGSYPPHGQVNNRQGDPSNNYSQGQMRNFPENHGSNAPQGQMDYRGAGMNYAPVPPVSRADGQSGVGSFAIGQGPTGNYGKGGNVGYDPGYTSHVGDQRFSQTPDHLNTVPTEHGNYPPADQNGMNQRRFG